MSRESSILILRVEGEEGRSGERSGERRGVVVGGVVVVGGGRWLFFLFVRGFVTIRRTVVEWSARGRRGADAARRRRRRTSRGRCRRRRGARGWGW